MDLNRADKLLALATDDSTTEEERRTAAVKLARMMREDSFLSNIRELVSTLEQMEVFSKRNGVPPASGSPKRSWWSRQR